MRTLLNLGAATLCLTAALVGVGPAQGADPAVTLFTNVNVFDGENEALIENANVVVTGNIITAVSTEPLAVAGGRVIDGGGRTLIPGLIDAHWHTMFNFAPISQILGADFGYLNIAAAKASENTLMRGFTTVRDVGGNSFGVKRAIDSGLAVGTRIYPSGGYIGQTSGHGDFRGPNDVPTNPGEALDYQQRVGNTLIADGVPDVIKRTREVLRMGASQVKAMGGGGVSSLYDPLDVTEYTFEEAKAIVDVAKTWNTYVAVHINTKNAIKMWVEAGAMSMEHGFFIDDEVAQLMAEKGVWWSMQPMQAEGEIAFTFESPISTAKYLTLVQGLEDAIVSAKKFNVNTAFGTDILFDAELGAKQGMFLASLQKWYTPFEALKMATHDNAQLLKLSGPRDPYPGDLGVIREGALADMILVDGNPLENLDLVADPEKNFVIIMKNGVIYKNALNCTRRRTMTFWSMLTTKVAADAAERSIAAFVGRRCIEESAETIPGFRHGQLLQSTEDPGVLCVLCSWDDKASYLQWLDSPLRTKQFPDLQGILTGKVESGMFRSVHEVAKP